MQKLSTGVEYQNPCFKEDFAEYLLANDFTCELIGVSTLHFEKGDKRLRAVANTITYEVNLPAEEDRSEGWFQVAAFEGLSHIGLFDFMLLMNAMRSLTIREFKANAKAKGVQNAYEAEALIKMIVNAAA